LDKNGTDDAGYGIAVDRAGNAYVTGQAGDWHAGKGLGAFAAKLSPTGGILYFVTFGADGILGLSDDLGARIAVDRFVNAYVVGTIFAPEAQPFPTTAGAFQTNYGGGDADAFVVKLDSSGNFLYSTLLGGPEYDGGWGIAVNSAGNAYLVGGTDGNFPTTKGVLQGTPGGGTDSFVADVDALGS